MSIYFHPKVIQLFKEAGFDTSDMVPTQALPTVAQAVDVGPTFMGQKIIWNSPSSPCTAKWMGNGFVLVREADRCEDSMAPS